MYLRMQPIYPVRDPTNPCAAASTRARVSARFWKKIPESLELRADVKDAFRVAEGKSAPHIVKIPISSRRTDAENELKNTKESSAQEQKK